MTSLTDRKLLRKIHNKYYDEFCIYDKDESSRSSKMYVPIDCEEIAKEFKIDPDIIFGRLYYHLDKKYGYEDEGGARVHLFSMWVGTDRHVVHFPLLSAVLAGMEESNMRFWLPITLSSIALVISITSFIINTL